MDIKDKISKLLALSESPNEHEAQLALLKARALMMQHKLTLQDVQQEQAEVIHRETSITFSKRRASWTLTLAGVIAENYCCRAFSRRRTRQQTRTVCLAGFAGDVEVCERVLHYALGCIQSWIRATTRLNRSLYTTKEFSLLSDSYAKGYIAGIYAAYRRQAREKGGQWAIVAAVPSEVDKSVSSLKTEKASSSQGVVRSIYNIGFGDGMRFCVADKLTGAK